MSALAVLILAAIFRIVPLLSEMAVIHPANQIGDASNTRGIMTQGQIGGVNTLVNQTPDRELDDAFRNAVLSRVPKTKQIRIMVLNGDLERDRWADKIDAFLRAEGYAVLSPHVSFLTGSGETTPIGTQIFPDNDDKNIEVIKIGANN
jgi:hypothetical protein